MSLGQAAGTAAALACETGCSPRALDVKRLQRMLTSEGAELRLAPEGSA
jgi:hypothetical protein